MHARTHTHTHHTQDVSRLVDLCRQSVVFDDPAGVLACLEAIVNDPDVELVSHPRARKKRERE